MRMIVLHVGSQVKLETLKFILFQFSLIFETSSTRTFNRTCSIFLQKDKNLVTLHLLFLKMQQLQETFIFKTPKMLAILKGAVSSYLL